MPQITLASATEFVATFTTRYDCGCVEYRYTYSDGSGDTTCALCETHAKTR